MSATLSDLVTAATIQLGMQEEVDRIDKLLKEMREQLRKQCQEIVPNLMTEVGIESFTLPNGFKVTTKDEVYAKIPEATAYVPFEWLRERNLDGIIKTNVSVDFGKGEDEEAQKIVDLLQEAGVAAMVKSSIHPMTLKSFLREQIERGTDVPLDAFGATVVKTTVIKQ
jgi:hypothetical protein